jgi:cobalamin biosynthesis protein CobT
MQTAPTVESIWAILQETIKMQHEKEKKREQWAKQQEQWEKERQQREQQWEKERQQREKEREKEYEKEREQRQASQADWDRRMKEIQETVGGWSNSHGKFAEDYFFNSFEQGQRNFFGEKFDEIEKNIKGFKKDFKDEYDILLINGCSLGIVEVKFKARKKDVEKVMRKAETFRVNFPEYKNHKIYLGLATMVSEPEIEQDCINQGIAVIKQVGDNVVINDENLKIF